ncbi:hypothetical protein ASG63_09435 [Methylobacterium sp. Leaf94]|uniref:hypothetical protein n=1 Tax=Methylobacterium sp. Leaf94 TaxID=1736250 RepID=UPI0006F7F68B|nr:hypothetical protein [Methylobacterium sp. Leaf94]KQU17703.1 hypothetical protein ASG63_09435 [Methylobacterium sp. Leaf94]
MNIDTVQAVEMGDPNDPSGSDHVPNLHDALLEGVSPDALAAAAGSDGAPVPVVTESATATTETSERVEDLTVVPEETAAPGEGGRETVQAAADAVEVATDAVETIAQTLPATMAEPLPAARSVLEGSQASFGKLADLAKSPRISEVMGELGEVNTTVLTYLRGEGAAAVAHWQALSGAKTPADAIRLQVTEMQRAADASLSCFAALAKRASRFTGTIGRR